MKNENPQNQTDSLKVAVIVVLLAGLFLMLVNSCGTDTDDFLPGDESKSGFSSLYNGYFQKCIQCHSPDGLGRIDGETEQNLNFSTKELAFSTITSGKAACMVGNQESCNGVGFISKGDASKSLLIAVLDENVRHSFQAGECDVDAISDMTVKVGSNPDSSFVSNLKKWINDGALND